MNYLEDHTLYYKKSCPFCVKVLRFMEANDITMDKRDTLQPGNEQDLIRVGGKKQVPCLVVAGKPLYESDDIVAYLREMGAAASGGSHFHPARSGAPPDGGAPSSSYGAGDGSRTRLSSLEGCGSTDELRPQSGGDYTLRLSIRQTRMTATGATDAVPGSRRPACAPAPCLRHPAISSRRRPRSRRCRRRTPAPPRRWPAARARTFPWWPWLLPRPRRGTTAASPSR